MFRKSEKGGVVLLVSQVLTTQHEFRWILIPISPTLGFSKFSVIRTKSNFPLPAKHCMLYKNTPDFSKLLIIKTLRTDYFSQRGSQNQDSSFHCFLRLFIGVSLMCP